jgi:hypothetical protein
MKGAWPIVVLILWNIYDILSVAAIELGVPSLLVRKNAKMKL